jgi:hypothetical protein
MNPFLLAVVMAGISEVKKRIKRRLYRFIFPIGFVACGGTTTSDAGDVDAQLVDAEPIDANDAGDVAQTPGRCFINDAGVMCNQVPWEWTTNDGSTWIGCELALCSNGEACRLRDSGVTGECR